MHLSRPQKIAIKSHYRELYDTTAITSFNKNNYKFNHAFTFWAIITTEGLLNINVVE